MLSPDYGNIYSELGEEAIKFIQSKVKVRSSFYFDGKKFVSVEGKQLVPFKLTPKQMEFVYVFTNPNVSGVVLKKPRQVGMTTLICALTLFFAYKYEKFNVYIISIKHEDAEFVVQTFMDIIDGIVETEGVEGAKDIIDEKEYKHLKSQRRVKAITLANGSVIYPLTTTITAGSGLTSGIMILDEFAKNMYAKEIYQSSIPALSTVKNSKFAIISTPFKQRSGEFYETFFIDAYTNDYQEIKIKGGLSKLDERKVVPIIVNWWEAPNRDNETYFFDPINFVPDTNTNKWIKEQIAKLTKGIKSEEQKREILNQELWGEFVFYDENFNRKLTSTSNFENINREIIDKILANRYEIIKNNGIIEEQDGLSIYKKPEDNGVYFMFVDWASGTNSIEKHAHAFVVWEIVNNNEYIAEAVCEYRGVITPQAYINLIINIAKQYNSCVIIPELNGIGRPLTEVLSNKYPNVMNEYVNIGKRTINKQGIILSGKLRKNAIKFFLEVGLFEGKAKVYSEKLVQELKNFNTIDDTFKIDGKPIPILDDKNNLIDVINDDLLVFPYSAGFYIIYNNVMEPNLLTTDAVYVQSIRTYYQYSKQEFSIPQQTIPEKVSFENYIFSNLLKQNTNELDETSILKIFFDEF